MTPCFCVQVHNRPFLRAGDKRTTGGGGGGGQGGRAAAARPNADGAAPKGKRSRGGSRKPAVKFEPGESLFLFAFFGDSTDDVFCEQESSERR